jgi:hypothetical protein
MPEWMIKTKPDLKMKGDNHERALSGQKLFLLGQLSVPIGTIGTEGKGKLKGLHRHGI